MLRSLKGLGVALAAAATLAGAAAAPASATTYHTKWTYIHFPIRWGFDDVPPRDLNLNGTYYWRAFASRQARPEQTAGTSRTVTLHGRYRWYDQIETLESQYYYNVRSVFVNRATGGTVSLRYKLYDTWGSGDYKWGSTIDNIRG